jgi:hypothetical protein
MTLFRVIVIFLFGSSPHLIVFAEANNVIAESDGRGKK